ncbi:MAG: AsmA family protein, partial [Kordiimonadaceae bacterium]|nr:AsmA family protein [Kordiimonadaceae bacterium]
KIVDYAGFNLDGSLTGKTLNTSPQFEASFNTAAPSLVALQRAYRFTTPYDIKQAGAIAITADIKGDFEKIDVDLKSTLGESKADVKGEIRSATLKQLPEIGSMDLNVVVANPSFINLIDQFDLPFENILASDDKPFSLNASLKSNQELLDIDGILGVAGGEVSLKGRASQINTDAPSFDMAVVLTGGEVREFIRGLGVDFEPAKNNLGPLNVKMSVLGTTNELALNDISGNIGPTKLSGTGSIKGMSREETSDVKPNLDFNLVLDSIPVHDFMEAEGDVNAKEEWGDWNKEPMELALLNEFDGKAVISANNIIYNKYNFNNPRFEAVLKDGVININNFTGKLFGGDVAVAGSFSSFGELDMDMSLKNAAIMEATTSVAGINPITGYFDMTKKFTGKGTSQDALISSLSGTGQITATPGIIKGINIPELSERLKGLNNQNGLLGLLSSTLSGGQTQYQGGASSITTKDGFIQLSPLDVQMQGAQSAVNLGISLANWKMNLDGDMSLIDHPDAPSIGISALGDLHEPDIKYNTKQLEGFITAKIASNLLQNMVDGNGGLGTLFGGAPATPDGTASAPQTAPLNPLERIFIPPAAEQPTAPEEPAAEEAPAAEQQQETVEELGAKLLNRLFKTPPR